MRILPLTAIVLPLALSFIGNVEAGNLRRSREDMPQKSAVREYKLTAITDMDKAAETEKGKYTWRAVTREGILRYDPECQSVTVTWTPNSDKNVTTHLNYKGRAMELSDLAEFHGRLLSPDDKTGMIYEIKNGKAIPWVFLNSGPGNTTSGMKAEWMTIKDDMLYVGGHGMEYRDRNGTVFSTDPMWIKTVSQSGEVTSIDWTEKFDKLRNKTGYYSPGYLTHEAAQWSDIHKKWFFLPRKANKNAYVESEDEVSGTNLLIAADEKFENIEVVKIRTRYRKRRGFAAFEFVPNTNDSVIVAIKSKEIGNIIESYITAFTTKGKTLLHDQRLDGGLKFEGLFLHRK